METLTLLKTLSEVASPAGRETAICKILQELWTPYVSELRVDAMGNLIALRSGAGAEPRRRLMLAAHMDEIGLIVTGFEGDFVRIQALGGADRRPLLGLEVCIAGREPVSGIIGSRPPHVLTPAEQQNIAPWHELFVDTGLKADEISSLVRVGDHVTVTGSLLELRNGFVAGKAFDNRASVAALTLTLMRLQQVQHAWDVYAVATVQEEVGLIGAVTSAYGLQPDIALAVDVTFGKQYNDKDPGTFDLGKGPTIGVGPNCHPQLVTRLQDAANAEEIPFAIEPLPGSSGTDAWGIQVAREGVPTGVVSIPLRYMHQPNEVVSLRDIERTARLLAGFTMQLSADYLPTWEDEE